MGKELAERTPMEVLQGKLFGEGSQEIFMDSLPDAVGEQGEKAAKRFAKMVYQAVAQSPDLQKCSVESIIRAASISASLNLDIDPRGLAYLVPFKNQAVFIVGYQGLMELARRSGMVKQFAGSVIYESEKDKVIISRINGRLEVQHPFSWEKPTGEIIGAYVTAEVEGYGPQTMFLRRDEIEFYRSKSACPGSPAWKNFYAAMCLKTCVRQLSKWLPKTVTEGVDMALHKEDNQATFVESREIAAKQIDAEVGSITPDDVFGENQSAPEQPKRPPFLDE